MFKVFICGMEVPGVHDFEGAKLMAIMLHTDCDAEVYAVDTETGEIVFGVFDKGDCWEIYEAQPDVIEVTEYIIIEL